MINLSVSHPLTPFGTLQTQKSANGTTPGTVLSPSGDRGLDSGHRRACSNLSDAFLGLVCTYGWVCREVLVPSLPGAVTVMV